MTLGSYRVLTDCPSGNSLQPINPAVVFHAYRHGNDLVATLGPNKTLFTLSNLYSSYSGDSAGYILTFVFEDNTVTVYLDGEETKTSSVESLSAQPHIVFAPFDSAP